MTQALSANQGIVRADSASAGFKFGSYPPGEPSIFKAKIENLDSPGKKRL